MAKGILGRKVGMTQIYDEAGTVIPVTVIEAGPCQVLQVKTAERDGHDSVQLGFLDKKRPKEGRERSRPSQASRSQRGHVTSKLGSKRSEARAAAGIELPAKAECEPKKFIRELRGCTKGYEVGQSVTVADLFETDEERIARLEKELEAQKNNKKVVRDGDKVAAVDVTGTSKGRGFAGVMKRHNFAGQRATHGVKKVHRHAGGTGMSASPSRLFKGKRMAGQYGNARSTSRNLQVVGMDVENNLLLVNGAVPGPNGGYLVIQDTNKVG